MHTLGIVAHTSRLTHAKTLAKQVKAAFISVDNGTLGCDANHDAVHRHLANLPTTWSVILEDDAVPVRGFTAQLKQALLVAPTPIVSLYLGRLRPPWAQHGIADATARADADGADWIVSSHLLHAVGYAIRTDLLTSLLAFNSHLPIDQHISAWAQQYGHTVSYAWPSLVDHRDDPTVIAHHADGKPRTPGRTAWRAAPHTSWSTTTAPLRTP